MKRLIFSITLLLVALVALAACIKTGGGDVTYNDVLPPDDSQNNTDVHVHTPGEQEVHVYEEPNCYKAGYGYYYIYCTECGVTLEEGEKTIDSPGHIAGRVEREYISEPNCTFEGACIEYSYCQWCDEMMLIEEKTLPKNGEHWFDYYDDVIVPPTCISQGESETVEYCIYCEKEFSRTPETLPFSDHKPLPAVEENRKEATCTQSGSYELVEYCGALGCGAEISRATATIPKAEHTKLEPVKENEVKPTCTNDGSYNEVIYCQSCEEVISKKLVTVPASHDIDEYGICVICDPDATRGLEYSETAGTASLVGRGTFKGDKLVLPSMYNGKRLTTINTNDFKNDTSLVSITVNSNIKSINNAAFEGCYRLVEIIANVSFGATLGSTNFGGIAYYALEIHNGKSKIGYNGCYFYIVDGVNYLISAPLNTSYIALPDDYFGEKYEINRYAFYGREDIFSILVPSGVTKIGDFAFGECKYLSSVTISDYVLSVSSSAFSACPIEEATVPVNFISSIPKTNLTSVTVIGSESSGNIPESAFKNCASLLNVVIGKNVLGIGQYAFSGCSSLMSVSVSDSVMTIGTGAFDNCYRLVEIINKALFKFEIGADSYGKIAKYAIEIHNGASKIINSDGYLFYTYDNVNFLVGYAGSEEKTTLPDNFKGENYVINDNAMRGIMSIKSLVVPSSVTKIGENAFLGCEALEELVLCENTVSIGKGAFDNCPIENATLPAKFISSIPTAKLITATITSGTKIEKHAFRNAALMTKISISSDIAEIESYAFLGCVSLVEISVDEDNANYKTVDGSLYTKDGKKIVQYALGKTDESFAVLADTEEIGDGAFAYSPNLKSFTSKESDKLLMIGEHAFNNCKNLLSVTISKNVEVINSSAFYNCSSLRTLVFEADSVISSVGENAFFMCPIKEATIPAIVVSVIPTKNLQVLNVNGGTQISDSSLSGCTALKNVTVGDSVKVIGASAFSGCTSLVEVSVGKGVTNIGESAFLNCTSLKDVYIVSLEKWCSIEFSDKQSNPLAYGANLYLNGQLVVDLVIPGSVTVVGKYAFYNCKSILTVVVSEGVKYISSSTFEKCDRMVSIEFPETLISIGVSAFNGCYRLAEVINHSSLSISANKDTHGQIGYYLSSVHKGESRIVNIDGYIFYSYYSDTYLITYAGEDKALTLPESCNGIGYSIRKNAFYGFDDIKSIVIPSDIKGIGEDAFFGCRIESVTLPVSAVPYISPIYIKHLTINGGETMDNKTFFISNLNESVFITLETLVIGDSVTVIEDSVFYKCKTLTSVTFGNGINSIGASAFFGCTSLANINIPKNVETIGRSAFYGCTSLKTVTFEEYSKLKVFAYGMFYGCSSLENVVMPKYITQIGEYAFYECTSLKEIVIPNSVTQIGSHAFAECEAISSVVIPDNVTTIAESTFYGCSSLESVVMGNNVRRIEENAFKYCTNLSSVEFKNPQAWSVGGEKQYTVEEMSDPENVAAKLIGYNANKIWTRI